jgi:hypothetical protein
MGVYVEKKLQSSSDLSLVHMRVRCYVTDLTWSCLCRWRRLEAHQLWKIMDVFAHWGHFMLCCTCVPSHVK